MLDNRILRIGIGILGCTGLASAAGPPGYYRHPAVHGGTVVFVAEGDLWKVDIAGGVASRLTSHPGEESAPAISPDGRTIAFLASYEGPAEVYTMPFSGGLPTRRTFDGERKAICGFAPDGRLLFGTAARCTLPGMQLMLADISAPDIAAAGALVPLWQAAEACHDDTGKQLFFTRFLFQGSHTKRYVGGTAQNLWRYDHNDTEATPLTAGYPGTSKNPMWWSGRVYFASDRDGSMNLWSMKADGSDLRQHTRHSDWDVIEPAMHRGRVVYQLGADIRLYEVAADEDRLVSITLDSDLDQTREHWIKRPGEYMTSAHLSPDGDRVAITARGQVFVVPAKKGRLVRATRREDVRCRNATFMPDGKSVLALSDESGEVELWKMPANGVGPAEQLTADGEIIRWDALPSPDGKHIAHHDKSRRLFIYDVATRKNRKIDESRYDDFAGLAWSPDSQWLAYVAVADNLFLQIRLYSLADGSVTHVTTDRFDSFSPAWSPKGEWLYLLSDRNLQSVVSSPWGNYQPEPFLDKKTEIFALALTKKTVRSPFAPDDELQKEVKSESNTRPASVLGRALLRTRDLARGMATQPAGANGRAPSTRSVLSTQHSGLSTQPAGSEKGIDLDGIESRLIRMPVPPGNYTSLAINEKALFWMSHPRGERSASLQAIEISRESPEVKTVAPGVSRFELSRDGKRLLIQKAGSDGEDNGTRPSGAGGSPRLYVIEAAAAAAPADLAKQQVDLSGWQLSVIPRQEWRQMFIEAWRLERDYFYDAGMHGVDWQVIRDRYLPLVDRVTDRAELSDLIAQMVSELSALHIFVRGGDMRSGEDRIMPASLGAVLERDAQAGGYRVRHVYQSDPDETGLTGPLRKLDVAVAEGDIIEMINGRGTLEVPDIGILLRGQAGQQVLLRVRPAAAAGSSRDVIVTPISPEAERNLRYHEWEYTRRLTVEKLGEGKIGYVHLRGMGGGNFTEWAKNFYPVWRRQGLIIDVRNNTGGNIDSWILGRLLRRAWFFWGSRYGAEPLYSMQYAFPGHIAVLCNERTMSDGEAFCDGIQRLKLGTVIGNRTWGGAIWLSFSNTLVDRGIASAAESGTYGPDGSWLIEGHGIDPDIVVENLPYATFKGQDAQLEAAIRHLQKRIQEEPVKLPALPKFPNKAPSRQREPVPAERAAQGEKKSE